MWTLTFAAKYAALVGLIHFFPQNSQTYARHLWQCGIRSRGITNWSMDKRKKIGWQFFSIISVFVVIHSQCVQSLGLCTKNASTAKHTLGNVGKFSFTFILYRYLVVRCNYASSRRERKKHIYEYTHIHTRIIFILKSDRNAKCLSNLMRIKRLFMVNIVWTIV